MHFLKRIFTTLQNRDNFYFIFIASYFSFFLITNLLTLTLSFYIPSTILKIIIFLRDFVPVIFISIEILKFLYKLLNKRTLIKITKLDITILVFIFYTFSNFIISKAPLQNKLFYIRAFVWPWLFYFWGRITKTVRSQLLNFFTLFMLTAFALYSFFSLSFWIFHLPQKNCDALENLSLISLKNYFAADWCLLNNSVSYDFLSLLKKPIIRLSGLILDPPITGTLLAPASFFIFLYPSHAPLVILYLLTLILTASKGGILLAIVYILLILLILLLSKHFSLNTIKKTIGIIFLLLIASIITASMSANNFGMFSHLNGLKQGVLSLLTTPLGTGLGTQGNFSNGTIRESYIGALLGQLGIPAFIYLSILFYILYKNIINGIKTNNYIVWAWNLFIFLLFIIAFLTESALAITSSSFFFFYLGLLPLIEGP